MEELIKSLSADGRAKSEELDRLQEKFKKKIFVTFFYLFSQSSIRTVSFFGRFDFESF